MGSKQTGGAIEKHDEKRQVFTDIAGILLLFLTIFFVLGFFSFNFQKQIIEHQYRTNLTGLLGVYFTYYILKFFGVSVVVFLGFVVYAGIMLIAKPKFPNFRHAFFKGFWVAILTTAIASSVRIVVNDTRFFSIIKFSGYLGEYVGEIIRAVLGSAGGFIFLILLIFLSISMIFNIELKALFKKIFSTINFFPYLWAALKKIFSSSRTPERKPVESLSSSPIEVIDEDEIEVIDDDHYEPPAKPKKQKKQKKGIFRKSAVVPEPDMQDSGVSVDQGEISKETRKFENEAEIVEPQVLNHEEKIPSPEKLAEEIRKEGPEQTSGARKQKKRGKFEPEIIESDAMKNRVEIDALESAVRPTEEEELKEYVYPSTILLNYEPPERQGIQKELLKENAELLESTLKDYGIEGKIVAIHPGPVITMYEYLPKRGTRISKIAGLSDDLTLSLKSLGVRIVAPIPGKGVIGIEVPNAYREIVYLKEIILSKKFQESKSKLTICLGKDIFGNPTVTDLAKMPHLLVAGATGSGKSVAINSFIISLLYKADPDELKFILIDPKMLELSLYQGIPHLITPVVTDPKQAAIALKWAVSEMERRYTAMSMLGVRNINDYNKALDEMKEKYEMNPMQQQEDDELANLEKMPYIVIIIDELADLMLISKKEVEVSIQRLLQMARAAGIHLILATQRPSVDVITGVIKANLPTRIAFQVASKMDSKVILDTTGAENLLGKGDMLFLPPGTSKLQRIHGSFVSTEEVKKVVNFVKSQRKPKYDLQILEDPGEKEKQSDEPYDELYEEALRVIVETGQASISYLQRRLKIGYNRAARIIERMEREGIVGPSDGTSRPREVYIDRI